MDFDQRADDFRMSWLHDDEDHENGFTAEYRAMVLEDEAMKFAAYDAAYPSRPQPTAADRICLKCRGLGQRTEYSPAWFGYGCVSTLACPGDERLDPGRS